YGHVEGRPMIEHGKELHGKRAREVADPFRYTWRMRYENRVDRITSPFRYKSWQSPRRNFWWALLICLFPDRWSYNARLWERSALRDESLRGKLSELAGLR